MKRWIPVISVLGVLTLSAPTHLYAAPFYEGKVVRVTVGFSAGGGFDLWARLIARHLGKNIPGHPTVIVENITGAGGLIQTNNLFKATKPDGLTIGHINGGLILSQASRDLISTARSSSILVLRIRRIPFSSSAKRAG
jgi:tripartite-type tricarboxylate transporter receptor subunit TctC